MILLLVHGWGFDRSIWGPLRAAMGETVQVAEVDFGYFSQPSLKLPTGPVAAIGHSFGAMWLLRHRPAQCRAFVAINGFDRFTEGDGAAGVPRRLLDRMLTRLEVDATAVVEDFRRRCGTGHPLPGGARSDRLRDDLIVLRDGDERAAAGALPAPILCLQGGHDPILPEALRETAFGAAASVRRAVAPEGGHLLPLTDAPWCAQQIRDFLNSLPMAA